MERVLAGGGARGCEAESVGQGERHEHRVQVVEAIVSPPDDRERQVELGGGEADDGVQVRIGHDSSIPDLAAAPVRADRAECVLQRQPLPDGHGLGTPVGGDAGRLQGRGHARRVEGKLPGEHVVEHLAPFAERGLDQPPELVLLLRG